MAQFDIKDPSPQTIQQFRQRRQKLEKGPSAYEKYLVGKEMAIFAGWFFLLTGSLNWALNPIGSNRRLQYERKLSVPVRLTRRYLPLGVILSALAYYDTMY